MYNVHISPYEQGNILIMTHYVPENYYYTKQINKLIGETKNTGITLVPLKVYIKDGYAKVLIGLAKGKSSTTSVKT